MLKLSTSAEFTKSNVLGRVVKFSDDVRFEMDGAGRYMKVAAAVTGDEGKKKKATISGLTLHQGVAHVVAPGSNQPYLFSAPEEIKLTVDLPAGMAAEDAVFRVFIDVFR